VTVSPARQQAMDALLDAAEALLIDEGYAAVTTRRLAERAGVNHGLVHYYFGSMEEVLLQTLERFTQRLLERQRAMYGSEAPFLGKWRTAMAYLPEDSAAGYPKVFYELQAMSWNQPEFRERVVKVNAEWRAVLTKAFEEAMRVYGIDRRRFPVEAIVSLVMTFNLGLQLEQLIGVDEGHAELLAMIDRWLSSLEPDQPQRPRSTR
jgi:AcrR family transcriptional regulator